MFTCGSMWILLSAVTKLVGLVLKKYNIVREQCHCCIVVLNWFSLENNLNDLVFLSSLTAAGVKEREVQILTNVSGRN